jgi:hypothetical protein
MMSLDDFYLAGRTMNMRVAGELRDAESSRLAGIALAGREKSQRLCCGAMSWLGRHLIAWGRVLEARYSQASSAPAPQSAKHLSS